MPATSVFSWGLLPLTVAQVCESEDKAVIKTRCEWAELSPSDWTLGCF